MSQISTNGLLPPDSVGGILASSFPLYSHRPSLRACCLMWSRDSEKATSTSHHGPPHPWPVRRAVWGMMSSSSRVSGGISQAHGTARRPSRLPMKPLTVSSAGTVPCLGAVLGRRTGQFTRAPGPTHVAPTCVSAGLRPGVPARTHPPKPLLESDSHRMLGGGRQERKANAVTLRARRGQREPP